MNQNPYDENDIVRPKEPIEIIGDGFYETVAKGNKIFVRPKWISVKDKAAPKKDKFLFSYHCGVGLGNWSQAYTIFNGNSERTHEIYFLVLWPMDISENNGEPMEWTEEKMIEMDVMWMPLPKPPEKDDE